MISRLRVFAVYNSLIAEGLAIDTSTAIELLQKEDPRINENNVVLYPGGLSSYGGIFKETNSTANKLNLFAVEMYAFNIYDIDTDKDFSLAGSVAIKIDYTDIKNPYLDKTVKDNYVGGYAEVYNNMGENNANKVISGMKEVVTIQGLILEKVADTFAEAAAKLNLVS